ncbi:hypothetical protein HKK72_10025 [Actinomadura sp. HBU206391]|nr:hypothetical protein [Actinomadura sp. HBU206391]
MESTPYVTGRIHATFHQVLSDGLRPDAVSGASGEQIDEMAAAQGVKVLPAALRQVYRLIGTRSALWLAGSSFGTALDGGAVKSHALATLDRLPNPFADAQGMYVLVVHQAQTFHVIDGTDLTSGDPPVWLIAADEAVIRGWDSVSGWFAAMAPDVARYRERLQLMRRHGNPIPPWARHLNAP